MLLLLDYFPRVSFVRCFFFYLVVCFTLPTGTHTADDALRCIHHWGWKGKKNRKGSVGCLEGRERRGMKMWKKKEEEERRHAINGGKGRGKVTNEKETRRERERIHIQKIYTYRLREFSTTKRPQKIYKRNKLFFGVMEEMLIIS